MEVYELTRWAMHYEWSHIPDDCSATPTVPKLLL